MTERQSPNYAAPDEDMAQYLSEIRAYPLLSEEEERSLARRCARGDEEAIRTMVSSNLRLVVSVARAYAGRGVPLMDLIQEGSIGLLTAARKFDCSRDCRFSTYATKWIRQGVTRCLLNHAGPIRVPAYTMERMKKVLHFRAELLQETGLAPTAGEIAAKAGMTEEKVTELLALIPEVCSLDKPTGESEEDTLGQLLQDAEASEPQEELVRQELEKTMNTLLKGLNHRQQMILKLHFGMEDGHCYSLEQIGQKLGISKERTRQIEKQAMEKLQKTGESCGLEDFL